MWLGGSDPAVASPRQEEGSIAAIIAAIVAAI
jgi:hypothetical protein